MTERRGRSVTIPTTSWQRCAHPPNLDPPPGEGLAVVHASNATVASSHFPDGAVGRDENGTSRKRLSDAGRAAPLPALPDAGAARDGLVLKTENGLGGVPR